MDNKLEFKKAQKQMSKRFLLLELKKALLDYEKAYNDKKISKEKLDKMCLTHGFCNYFFWKPIPSNFTKTIIEELFNDLKESFSVDVAWYKMPCEIYMERFKFFQMTRIKKSCLQPRIKHLKRTIARLEKELNIES